LRERRRADRATRNLQLRFLTHAGLPRRYDLDFVYISLSAVGLGGNLQGDQRRGEPGEALGTQGVARDVTELVMLQDFSSKAELILPACSICHKIRVTVGSEVEWIPLSELLTRKTGALFSHTYCPDHVPET
jgi:hypothetical protein